MTGRPLQLLMTVAVSLGLALSLAACGKKGSPRPPEGEESQYTYPQAYPAPGTVTPDGNAPEGHGTDPFSIFTGDDRRTTTKTY